MFDLGFTELLLVFVVGLLVIGPEQLPGAVRTVSAWLGRIRRGFNDIKSSLAVEIGVDEMQAQMKKDSILSEFREHAAEFEALGSDVDKANIDLLDSFSFSGEKAPVEGRDD